MLVLFNVCVNTLPAAGGAIERELEKHWKAVWDAVFRAIERQSVFVLQAFSQRERHHGGSREPMPTEGIAFLKAALKMLKLQQKRLTLPASCGGAKSKVASGGAGFDDPPALDDPDFGEEPAEDEEKQGPTPSQSAFRFTEPVFERKLHENIKRLTLLLEKTVDMDVDAILDQWDALVEGCDFTSAKQLDCADLLMFLRTIQRVDLSGEQRFLLGDEPPPTFERALETLLERAEIALRNATAVGGEEDTGQCIVTFRNIQKLRIKSAKTNRPLYEALQPLQERAWVCVQTTAASLQHRAAAAYKQAAASGISQAKRAQHMAQVNEWQDRLVRFKKTLHDTAPSMAPDDGVPDDDDVIAETMMKHNEDKKVQVIKDLRAGRLAADEVVVEVEGRK